MLGAQWHACSPQGGRGGSLAAASIESARTIREPLASPPCPLSSRPSPNPFSGSPPPFPPLVVSLEVRQLVPFLACGDLSGWDADRSYDLPTGEGYVPLDPVAPPTAPPYKTALELAKGRDARHG